MESSDLQRIQHIKRYCEDVAKAIQRFGADYEIFLTDIDYFNSVSMSTMQIGELSIGLTDTFKNDTKEQMQWGAMRSMRNMYAHAYAKMDKLAIWETATKDIPGLLKFCDRIIERSRAEVTPPLSSEKPSILEQLEKDKKAISENYHQAEKDKGIDTEL